MLHALKPGNRRVVGVGQQYPVPAVLKSKKSISEKKDVIGLYFDGTESGGMNFHAYLPAGERNDQYEAILRNGTQPIDSIGPIETQMKGKVLIFPFLSVAKLARLNTIRESRAKQDVGRFTYNPPIGVVRVDGRRSISFFDLVSYTIEHSIQPRPSAPASITTKHPIAA
jgi:hypothetical protein